MEIRAKEYFRNIAGFYPTDVKIDGQEVVMRKAKFELRVHIKDLK